MLTIGEIFRKMKKLKETTQDIKLDHVEADKLLIELIEILVVEKDLETERIIRKIIANYKDIPKYYA